MIEGLKPYTDTRDSGLAWADLREQDDYDRDGFRGRMCKGIIGRCFSSTPVAFANCSNVRRVPMTPRPDTVASVSR